MKRIIFILITLFTCFSLSAIKTATDIKCHLDSVASQDPEGKNTLAYCENLNRAVDDLLGIGEGREATNLVTSFLDSWKKRWGFGNTYAFFYMRQADILLQRGMTDVANKCINLVINQLSESCDSIIRYQALVIAAEINVANGNIKDAEAQLDKAEREFLVSTNVKQLYRIYGTRYEIATKYGDYEQALIAAKKQMNMATSAYGKNSQKYICALLRAYETYIFNAEIDDNELENEFYRVQPLILSSQNNLETSSVALYYHNQLDFIKLYSMMIICKGAMTDSDKDTIDTNLSIAIKTLFELNKIFTRPVLLTGYAQKVIGELAASIDKYSIANQGLEYAYRLEKALHGDASIDTAIDYALTLMYVGKVQESTELLSNSIKDATKQTLQNFRRMTASERADYWNTTYTLYQRVLTAALETKTTGDFPTICYDILLLTKGLLLNSEMECKNLIESSNDNEIIDLYHRWVKSKHAVDYAMQNNGGNTDSSTVNQLVATADNLEQQLMQKSTEFGDFTSGFNITHTDVQKSLKPGDIAIEFVSVYPPDMLGENIYCAYILTSIGDADIKILGNLESLYSLVSSSDQAFSQDVYDMIWAPILSKIKNVKRVFFSPAGILNNLAIEYATGCENYEFYRLSSTRELAENSSSIKPKNAIIYGGLSYGTDIATLEKDSKKYPNIKRTACLSIGDLGAGFNDLAGTKSEAESINKMLKTHNIETILYIGPFGTETSFKSICSDNNLIHLATHGFYYTEEEARQIDLAFIQATSHRDFSEDDVLKRSGLVFSGANNIIYGIELPQNVDDGILTSYEIARLNLKNINLVTLSACQTGLGDVASDGVFGLQRGFKKAGAKSLLMSLWKVDDEATKILMTQFYANLMLGKSKRQSLLGAQRYLREYKDITTNCNPYDSPQFWGAFILLDALD